ncbi:MAG: hypothetical protein ACFFBU_08465 [Promethearchaeota archaeon]
MSPTLRKIEPTKDKWTAIGVTTDTKKRFVAMKNAFEKTLNLGPQTWDYFFNALLDLGPLTWNFLIKESIKSLQASMEPCPFPEQRTNRSKETPAS